MSEDMVQWMREAGSKYEGMSLSEWHECVKHLRTDMDPVDPAFMNKIEMSLSDAGWTPKETPKGLRYWVRAEDSP